MSLEHEKNTPYMNIPISFVNRKVKILKCQLGVQHTLVLTVLPDLQISTCLHFGFPKMLVSVF